MIEISGRAAESLKKSLSARGRGEGVRFGVKSSGCSGFSYIMEFVDVPTAEDSVFEVDGVKVFMDAKSLPILDGMKVDFVKEGLNEGFRFENPNSVSECGCGKSFSV